MMLPAEIESKIMIPLLRAMVAKRLVYERGYTQEKVAQVLGVTQAAVSNYLRGVRGISSDLEKHDELVKWADEVVEAVVKNEPRQEIARRINDALKNIRVMRILCEYHKRVEPDIDVDSCHVCD
ncbi:conserved hypothetical protein [Candidatus Caldarchaeum subterraneum]|uniref:HTH cro/C1-type domain-containing protein n=1 Tax=Caldiarchaeum subterraneum TaxID=311458 RepID=E6N943_CALS0|nr:conserved hypothetical protein [Candidatus Caldarchaeum subterraneum]BAJ48857.1 conserved hypothetical protein [Candidatus Caldarchaeum subterraneum]BAJ49750.1 conserved hypothetical protein [Candidatus Caldarchaeum subterraneum]BAJ51468.1 conserved hypothetical protein [Candidatus Caldarchaeum subterraneum]